MIRTARTFAAAALALGLALAGLPGSGSQEIEVAGGTGCCRSAG